jgi:hypothetical protein
VTEAADEPETIELPRALFEAADEQHLAIELEQLVLARLETLRLFRTLDLGFLLAWSCSSFLGGFRHGILSYELKRARL